MDSLMHGHLVTRFTIQEQRSGGPEIRRPGSLFTAALLWVPGVREALRAAQGL